MNCFKLPEGYALVREVDLMRNKKLAVWVNVLGALILLAMIPLGLLAQPENASLFSGGMLRTLARLLALFAAIAAYMALHELTHSVFIRLFCGKWAKLGFNGLYAYAGRTDAYFTKLHYGIIALSPVVLWGAALAALCRVCPPAWFWPVYILQMINISGAAGDFYVTALLCRLPQGTLCNDEGTRMRFFARV